MQDKWTSYEDLKTVFLRWLTETEKEVKLGVEPKTELVEKKAQLEKYRVS